MKSILRFLKQPSTWKGIAWLFTLLGIGFSTEQWQVISGAGVAIVAVIEVFTDEDKRNLPPIELQSKSENSFQRYDDPDDDHPDPAAHRMRDAVPSTPPSQADMDKHETGFNS